MVQTLVIIGSIIVLAGAILTSTLASAKNAFHQVVAAKTQTAMTEADSQFLGWAQHWVAQYETETDMVKASSDLAPTIVPLCSTPPSCSFNAAISYKVTGQTFSSSPAAGTAYTTSQAVNMAPALDEQRISATINVVISDATGRRIYGGRTHEVTARIFDASPYVVITGLRDSGSDSGTTIASEGDSGGTSGVGLNFSDVRPNAAAPGAYVDTTLKTTIDCVNAAPFDEADPTDPIDNGSQIDFSIRSGGANQWSYQMPCAPTSVPSAPTGVTDYTPPSGTVYSIGTDDSNKSWQKGDSNSNSFAR